MSTIYSIQDFRITPNYGLHSLTHARGQFTCEANNPIEAMLRYFVQQHAGWGFAEPEKFFVLHESEDIWDPERWEPAEGIELIHIPGKFPWGEPYQRAGTGSIEDNLWQPMGQMVLLHNRETKETTYAVEIEEWHGGINSGDPYIDYEFIIDMYGE